MLTQKKIVRIFSDDSSVMRMIGSLLLEKDKERNGVLEGCI